MFQSFVIVLREGFESFLIVAIIAAYLQKTGRRALMPAVGWGIAASLAASVALGFALLQGANEPLWEGWTGLFSAVFVSAFVVHMWKTAGRLKKDMESGLARKIEAPTTRAAFWGVFAFTVFMIAREGMETALLLIQVREGSVWGGALLGLLAAAGMALLWTKVGHRIHLKLFFQVTALFLLLFVGQILLYSFHEFCEAGLLPASEYWHLATEPYSPDGIYGKWISVGMVGVCAAWLLVAWVRDRAAKTGLGRSVEAARS